MSGWIGARSEHSTSRVLLFRDLLVKILLVGVTFYIRGIFFLVRNISLHYILKQPVLFLLSAQLIRQLLSQLGVSELACDRQLLHHLEKIALIDQELLSLVGVVHLLGVCGNQGVEVGVEVFLVSGCLLCSVLLRS